jgi:hypothetical protein
MRFRDGSDKGTASNCVLEISEKVRRRLCNDYTSVRGRKHEPYREFKLIQTQIGETGKNKVKSMFIIIFDMYEIVHKEFFLAD